MLLCGETVPLVRVLVIITGSKKCQKGRSYLKHSTSSYAQNIGVSMLVKITHVPFWSIDERGFLYIPSLLPLP